MVNVTRTILIIMFATASVVIVCLPRFNRGERISLRASTATVSTHKLWDAAHYVRYVEYFRAVPSAGEPLRAPFVFRPVAPLLASAFPFDPMTSINIVNILALIAATVCLHRVLGTNGFGRPLRLVGCGLFVFSFPTLYYGAIGYVDPLALCMVTVDLLLIRLRKWGAALLAIALGAAVKETTVVILPVLAVAALTDNLERRAVLWKSLLGAVAFSASTLLVRALAPATDEYLWTPSLSWVLYNVGRRHTWLSLALTVGIPGVLITIVVIRAIRHLPESRHHLVRIAADLTGVLSAAGIWAWSVVSAHADGRALWMGYPFAISSGLLVIERWAGRERTVQDLSGGTRNRA